jgi:hypothetical protein
VTPLLTGQNAGDAYGTVSTVPASAPVKAGGGFHRGGKAVYASAARSIGNERRVDVPLSLAPAIGRTTSSGGNCFRFTRTRFFIFFIYLRASFHCLRIYGNYLRRNANSRTSVGRLESSVQVVMVCSVCGIGAAGHVQ